MLRWHISERYRKAAHEARAIAGRINVLYHGTGHPRSVLGMNTLFYSYPGSARSPEVAAYFALSDRDNDEDTGAILIFDRASLRCRYRLEPWHDPIWDGPDVQSDEMEERVWRRDIKDIRRHLIGVVPVGGPNRSSTQKKQRNRLYRMCLRLRAEGYEPEAAYQMVMPPIPSDVQEIFDELRKRRNS
jgi:hypothetical protein